MAKERYRVELGEGEPHRISRYWWDHYVRQGWLVRVSKRLAKLRVGVVGWIEDGALRLRDTLTKAMVSIPSSWRLVEQAAIYGDRGPRLTPDALQREIQSQYAVRT